MWVLFKTIPPWSYPCPTTTIRTIRDSCTCTGQSAADCSSSWPTARRLLRGLKATTHWLSLERLRDFGAEPTTQRVVREGKIITAAGVSAGIDMALELARAVAGDDVAQAIQLSIEYDPQPPFDSGSPAKAPPHIAELVRQASARARAAS